ncbi:MAG: class II fumarate hydratase, partial [Deltaproteobacteria bacterium]
QEVIDGKLDAHFVVDIFQTGSGTSTNMNANEVIANRAIEILGGEVGSRSPVHPNDHVNMGQSSNDVIPSAIRMAALALVERELLPALRELHEALSEKARVFDDVIKIGRTHLQDATPLRLGQEFGGYARQVALSIERISAVKRSLAELPLGGTAVGTGLNAHPEFARRVIAGMAEETNLPFVEAENHFEAQGAADALVEAGAALKTAAVSLIKIGNDIRFLASGPRCGIGELKMPAVQPGSSIMPGKVNPVIVESLIMACAHVIGADATLTLSGQLGYFELNLMLPVMAYNLHTSIEILAASARNFSRKCVVGLEADRKRCAELVEQSLALVTPLAPVIGYDAAAEIAKESYRTGKTVRELVRERKILPEAELEEILDLRPMTEPGIHKKRK